MQAIARCLRDYIEHRFQEALERDPDASVRPVVIGPPDSALLSLFNLLTQNGAADWKIQTPLGVFEVVVLLLNPSITIGMTRSKSCNWDYAVTIRNCSRLVLILSSRNAWDSRPESLANTTETLGDLGAIRARREDPLQAHLTATIATLLSLSVGDIGELIGWVRRESASVEPNARDLMTWDVLEALLTTPPGNVPDDVCGAVGLPPIASAGLSFEAAHSTLKQLAHFVGDDGFSDAFEQMKNTTVAQAHGVVPSVDLLRDHLASRLFSPTLFSNAPMSYYRTARPHPGWQTALSAKILADILAELNQVQPQDRLTLRCHNGIPGADPLTGGLYVTNATVELRASNKTGGTLPGLAFSRKIDRASPVQIPNDANDNTLALDSSVPLHRKPIKYKSEAIGHRAATLDVIVLDAFECGGLVIARDADRIAPPAFNSKDGTWSQEISLTRGGTTSVSVLHSSSVASVKVIRDGRPDLAIATTAGQHSVVTQLDIENNDEFIVKILDGAGAEVGTFTVLCTVREFVDIASSRFEALVLQHRHKRKYVAHAEDIPLHRLELNSYLANSESWQPVIACWSDGIPSQLAIDWQAAVLGDVAPEINPKPHPAVAIPPRVLEAREVVRFALLQQNCCVSEADFTELALRNGCIEYLRQYGDWIKADPHSACWLDSIAVYSTEWNPQAGKDVPSDEPGALLLSALHPIRLAWHALAQDLLVIGMSHPCPAAGLISPLQTPDSGVLYLSSGFGTVPRAYFSLPCDHPHWAVLLNTAILDKEAVRARTVERLLDLGLHVQAITGGFSSQQTLDCLREVNRLLPARATLRIGIVGDSESSSDCGQGVLRWSEDTHADDIANPLGCAQIEVFDTRGATDPSPEELASLSEATSERVRWFKLRPDAQIPNLDLTIIDQLGARSREAINGSSRSLVSAGCLYRSRIREDFHDARSIWESRIARSRVNTNDLPGLLTQCVSNFEALSLHDSSRSHLSFTPNQEALGSRLRNAIFLSVTSSQIDPACVVRGTVGQKGYLWDFELPGILGSNKSTLGYYLVAEPTQAMCDAVERAASLVSQPPPDVHALLEEVSRHGIPVLKRLAGGGSQSRGELGLLLATRLVQDCFRPQAGPQRLPVTNGKCIHFVLPVDPYEEVFDLLRRPLVGSGATAQRPDLVLAAIQRRSGNEAVAIKITPIEVKFRAAGMPLAEMRDALKQAEALGALFKALWVKPPMTDAWRTCSLALLAQFIDFGFRIYAGTWLHHMTHEEWTQAHEEVMQDILERVARVTVIASGRLLVFGGQQASKTVDLDGDSLLDTAIISMQDSSSLLSGQPQMTQQAHVSVASLGFTYSDCAAAQLSEDAPALETGAVNIETNFDSAGTTETAEPAPVQAPQSGAQDAQAPIIAPQASNPQGTDPQVNASGVPDVAPSSDSVASTGAPRIQRIPSEVRAQVRNAFTGFVGNEAVIQRLSNDLLRALIERPPYLAKNYLLTGLPSTGKTELARRIARALTLPFVKLDGRGVSSREKLFDLINGELASAGMTPSQTGQQLGLPVLEYPPLIVFVDEVHLVPRAVQEALLTMLEAADRTVVLTNHVARVPKATFLFATTRSSEVDPAFVTRCEEIPLREYTEDQVAEIIRRNAPHADWSDDTYHVIARLGRCVPRIAIQLAGALETAILVAEGERSVSEHLEEVRSAREIDPFGLTRMDLEYLSILERASGPVGEQHLLQLARTVDKDRILNEVEPFLVRLGFITHGPRGRELTTAGREYYLAHRVQRG
jgi:Holliday junction resolvasome RuvABC ATP-dependent DNA helicase subunit